MFNLAACHVERTKEQNYLIRWRSSRPGQRVAVYMSDLPNHFYSGGDPGTPILYTTNQEARVSNPEKDVRHYFRLESDSGEEVILAERQMSLTGAPNFRDLGGYEAGEGRRLKWGKLYRSSKLSDLTDSDIQYVSRLGVTLICDFRQVIEQQLEPTLLGDSKLTQLASLPISPGSSHNFMENLHNGVIAVKDAARSKSPLARDHYAGQARQRCESPPQ